MGTEPQKKIYIVDDHPIICDALSALCDENNYVLCGCAHTVTEALGEIAGLDPDMIICDVELPDQNGIDLIEELTRSRPGLPVLMYSVHFDPSVIESALRAGARGYVIKTAPVKELMEGVKTVLAGGTYTSKAPAERWSESESDLSSREQDIYQMMGRGYTTPQIATKLSISPKTVESYYERLKVKLSMPTTADLRRNAIESAINPFPGLPSRYGPPREEEIRNLQQLVFGLTRNCPNHSTPDCPFQQLRELPLEERLETIESISLGELREMVAYHQDCFARR